MKPRLLRYSGIHFLMATALFTGHAFAGALPQGAHLGCGACLTDDKARDVAVGGLYRLIEGPASIKSIAISPAANDWSQADRVLSYNDGHRVLWYAETWPDWWSRTNQTAFIQQFSNHVAQVARRYPNLWCIQVSNEPSFPQAPSRAIPEVASEDTLYPSLVKMYRAAKAAVKGTKILIGGLSLSQDSLKNAGRIMDEFGGRKYVDVVIVHDYSHKHPLDTVGSTLPADVLYAKWKAIADNKPLVVGEFGIYGQSASSQVHPNTGPPVYVTGFTEREAVRDAITYAILMRAAGVDVIIPHVLTNGGWHGDPAHNYEISGWEFWDGVTPFKKIPMKSKTKAFLDAMKLLDGLTAAQIQALAKLVRSMGGAAQSP